MYGLHEPDGTPEVTLLGSGCILGEVLKARETLEDAFGLSCRVCSVTSYGELHRDAWSAERWNRNHPAEESRKSHVETCLADGASVVVAASDYVRALPGMIARWVPSRYVTLGTDGFGRSDGRPALRSFFEVDSAHIAYAALDALTREGVMDVKTLEAAAEKLGIDRTLPDPTTR
jgi:pyruvate dehydrogenase E1 component